MENVISGFPRGDIRVSDAERDQAIAELSEQFQAGRLTQEEFEDRSGRALAARTGADLRALFTDLPQEPVLLPPDAGPAGTPFPGYARRRCARTQVARVVIACVIAAIIAGNVLGGTGHASFGWLVPVVILGFVFLRVGRRRCR
jgi:hypothetical protein